MNKQKPGPVVAVAPAPQNNQPSKEQEALVIFEQLKRARGLNLSYDEFARVDIAIKTLKDFVALHQPGNPQIAPTDVPAPSETVN